MQSQTPFLLFLKWKRSQQVGNCVFLQVDESPFANLEDKAQTSKKNSEKGSNFSRIGLVRWKRSLDSTFSRLLADDHLDLQRLALGFHNNALKDIELYSHDQSGHVFLYWHSCRIPNSNVPITSCATVECHSNVVLSFLPKAPRFCSNFCAM